jgi:hypothetical protein
MRHIAVIMDGNRRFGREKFSDALQGHWEGGKVRPPQTSQNDVGLSDWLVSTFQKLSDFTRWCIKRKIEVVSGRERACHLSAGRSVGTL